MSHETIIKFLNKANDLNMKAQKMERVGDFDAAKDLYIEAAEVLNALVRIAPKSPQVESWLSTAEKYLGRARSIADGTIFESATEKRMKSKELADIDCDSVGERFDPERNDLNFEKLAGLKEVKEILRRAIEWSLKYPEKMEEHGLEATKGILLVGPPGCGKTYLVKCTAGEFGVRLLIASPATTYNKYVGETSKAIKKIFQCGAKLSPSIIFIDEIDKLLPDPSRTSDSSGVGGQALSTFQQEMDGAQSGTGFIVLMATNDPELLHPALARTGRVSYRIYVPPPDDETRAAIFKIHLKAKKLVLAGDVDFKHLAELTAPVNGWYYSGSDIEEICRRAKEKRFAQIIASENQDDNLPLTLEMIQDAITTVKRSISPELISRYEKWSSKYAS
ncbi:MAG: AAA family ATPase [Candidatus Helarchaeales archaeon]